MQPEAALQRFAAIRPKLPAVVFADRLAIDRVVRLARADAGAP